MVETHGGGLHYVPEDEETRTKGVNAPQPLFHSLENPERLLLLARWTEADVAPLEIEKRKLQYVQTRLSPTQIMTDGSVVAALLRDGTVSQCNVDNAKLYDPLIPGDLTTKQIKPETLVALADAMLVDSDPISNIPAAYTYFGQFLAHDMSYMQQIKARDGTIIWRNNNGGQALEFDSLFGTVNKPGEPTSDWILNADTALGRARDAGAREVYDLPRHNADGGVPCCKDPRADSNLGLSQMHVLLVRFHQALADKLALDDEKAREATKKHLQAVVLTDYLPRLVPLDIFADVMKTGRRLVAADSAEDFLVPLEFATAIFRFGHSMIRNTYENWSVPLPPNFSIPASSEASVGTLLRLTSKSGGLSSGMQKFAWCTQWRNMIGDLSYYPYQQVWARGITASIARSLGNVPPQNFPDLQVDDPLDITHFNLAHHTLKRGHNFNLPSGQALACCAGLTSTLDVAAFLSARPERFAGFSPESAFFQNTPLWFYVLAEAENQADGKLGPLAGRIVMETFHAALERDACGILKVDDDKHSQIDFKNAVSESATAHPYLGLSQIVKFTYPA